MLIQFFNTLRRYGVPVTLKELLDLLEALRQHLVFCDVNAFYFLSRAVMVKDEKYFDRFDRAFGAYFKDIEAFDDLFERLIPDEWLRSEFSKQLSDEEKAKIESLGSLEKLIDEFRQRMEEQNERHEGGSKWIGTGGTSPFGQGGYHPEGIRVGPKGGNKSAVKVWEQRDFRNLDDDVELGVRNIKVALRRLRKFISHGEASELDLANTVRSTADNAGLLDIKMQSPRRNMVKVLLFLDVGGSMDPHSRMCAELFSASRSMLKHMDYFYFHNFVYESVWKDNYRRHSERHSIIELTRTYGKDYKLIFVGDAAMSPYEILQPGGSVEHWNDEPGAAWMNRLTDAYERVVWLNPVPREEWQYTQSIDLVHELVKGKMYPLTLRGLDDAMASLML